MYITLKKIDEHNFITCFNLKLAQGQDRFVSHPIRSLAQAYVYRNQSTPFGIYDQDLMVGYVMVIYDFETTEYNIWHMMIDESQQGKGYGKGALQACLEYIAQKPFGDSKRINLTCHLENTKAYQLYENFGFVRTDKIEDEEVEMVYDLI